MKTFKLFLIFLSISLYAQTTNTVNIDASKAKYRISKNIYGHFSEHLGHCIYEGMWVGENSKIPNKNGLRTDVVEALKKIKVPALRWPGGCFADEYHWKDGIGPRDKRPSMINTNWGGVTEDNSFGTHEFLELCNQLGCEPYISGNLGSGTIQELSQWVEYVNSDNVSPMTQIRKQNGREKSWGVKFWGIGNESWGCGGNMKPDYYSDVALQFSNFMRKYGNYNLNKIAVGPSSGDYNWTETVMRDMGSNIWGLSLHHYTWAEGGETATDVTEARWFGMLRKTLEMEELVTKHSAIMDKYDPGKSVALVVDEWGAWYTVEPGTNPGFLFQQNTLRDGLIAGINLNIFNNHCARVKMAAVAQIVNVLQSVILTEGSKMVLTPTYHVFDMYKVHQEAMMVPSELKCENYIYGKESIPALNVSSSIDRGGKMHVSVCNLNPDKNEVLTCNITGFKASAGTGQILTSDKLNAHNTFENPNAITLADFKDFKVKENIVEINVPAHSVLTLELTGKLEEREAAKINEKELKPGLKYSLYEGNWNRLPVLTELTPVKEGTTTNIQIPEGVPSSNYGLNYTGYIKIDKEGMYDFFLNSDDGSKLAIDGEDIVVNDGLHGMIEQSGTSFLGKGYHEINISFFQGGGGAGLEVKYQPADKEKQSIPDSILFHK